MSEERRAHVHRCGLLADIYGFLYVALQLQDYALLLGTGGLFAVLAAVIWLTRNIDWYERDRTCAGSLGAAVAVKH